jgi:hypothetical protein
MVMTKGTVMVAMVGGVRLVLGEDRGKAVAVEMRARAKARARRTRRDKLRDIFGWVLVEVVVGDRWLKTMMANIGQYRRHNDGQCNVQICLNINDINKKQSR